MEAGRVFMSGKSGLNGKVGIAAIDLGNHFLQLIETTRLRQVGRGSSFDCIEDMLFFG